MRARSGGRCEGCGTVARLEAHHCQFRSRGGQGGAGNGLLLCGFGNSSGCHGIAHSGEGARRGWAVATGADPEQVPRVSARFGLVWMKDSGLVLAAEGSACWAHKEEVEGHPGCGWCVPVGRVLWDVDQERGWSE